MTETARSHAETVRAEFDVLRVLVDCVDTKVAFFIQEKSLFGPYHDFIKELALDIQTLLGVINHEIYDMEKEQSELVHILVRGEAHVAMAEGRK